MDEIGTCCPEVEDTEDDGDGDLGRDDVIKVLHIFSFLHNLSFFAHPEQGDGDKNCKS
jgi:hypothetical protein